MSPFTVPYMLTNMSGAILGMQAELGFRGPNYAVRGEIMVSLAPVGLISSFISSIPSTPPPRSV